MFADIIFMTVERRKINVVFRENVRLMAGNYNFKKI